MADFLKNKAKIILLVYGAIIFVALLFGLYFMTRYAHIHIAYSVSNSGVVEYAEDLNISSMSYNTNIFQYFSEATDTTSPVLQGITRTGINTVVTSGYAETIYNFQKAMSSFNTLIIVLEVLSILAFAVMLIFSNHTRKVYYKDNVVVGVLMPLIVSIFSLVLLINNFGLMGTFNSNLDLFKTTSFLGNPDTSAILIQKSMQQGGYSIIQENTQGVNSTTFIIATFVFIFVILVSVLMAIYSVYRYKECAKRRNDIIERAANNND